MNENAGSRLEGLVTGNSQMSALASGTTNAIHSDTFNRTSDILTSSTISQGLGGNNSAAGQIASDKASNAIGSATAVQNEGFDSAVISSRIDREGNLASGSAVEQVSNTTGQSTRDFLGSESLLSQSSSSGKIDEMSKDDGLLENAMNQGREEGTRGRATAEHVASHGTNDIFLSESQNIGKEVETAKAIDNTNSDTNDYFYKSALRETAEQQGKNIGAGQVGTEGVKSASAGDQIEDYRTSLAKTDEAGGRLVDRDQMAWDQTKWEASDSMAETQLKERMMTALEIGETELSHMMLGESSYNLNAKQAQKAHDADLITEEQLNVAQRNGSAIMALNATASPMEGLDVHSAAVNYTDTSTSDRSITDNDSISRDVAIFDMNEDSNRMLFSDSKVLAKHLDDIDSRGINPRTTASQVGIAAAGSVRDLFTTTESDTYTGTTGASLQNSTSVSVGGDIGFASADNTTTGSIYGHADDIHVKERTENATAQHFAQVYKSLDTHYSHQVESGEINESQANQKVADGFSGYYNHISGNMATEEFGEYNKLLVNGNIDNIWGQYSKESGLNIGLSHRSEVPTEGEKTVRASDLNAEIPKIEGRFGGFNK